MNTVALKTAATIVVGAAAVLIILNIKERMNTNRIRIQNGLSKLGRDTLVRDLTRIM